jgi:DNA-binding transcriptional ArsR family regulator
MDSYRIKVKIGENEFEAEGSPEMVKAQFEAFKEMLASIPVRNDTPPSRDSQQAPASQAVMEPTEVAGFEKIFRVESRVISLTALPGNVLDATLLTMFGQRHFRNNDSITGAEVKDGLEQSGFRVDRVDRHIDKLTTEGLVIKIGIGKGSRYRLTNQGMARAQGLARDLIATLP